MNFTSGPWTFEKDNTLKTEYKEMANELSNFFTSVLTKRSDTEIPSWQEVCPSEGKKTFNRVKEKEDKGAEDRCSSKPKWYHTRTT